MTDIMTDQELNIIIAEWNGYTDCYIDEDGISGGFKKCNRKRICEQIPNFVGDLNLIHETEIKVLQMSPALWLKYIDALMDRKDYRFGGACPYIAATARERAETIVKILGKKMKPKRLSKKQKKSIKKKFDGDYMEGIETLDWANDQKSFATNRQKVTNENLF